MDSPDIEQGRVSGRLGTVLRGKYHLERVLGVGGMAVVYAATHRNRKRFAVKMLHPELSIRQDIRTRFLREGYVANSVDHPGAVAVLDEDTAEDGAAFIVMELLEGDGVDHLWAKAGQRLGVRASLAIGHQLLDVLASAHARTIVHRDIKPANIFVTLRGRAKILDFGLAKFARAAGATGAAAETGMGWLNTTPGMVLGTYNYMSPEQARGQELDSRTDLFSLGVVLYEIATGVTPFRGTNMGTVLESILDQAPAPPASLNPKVPAGLERIIAKCLEKDRDLRYQRASDVYADLQRLKLDLESRRI
jgi:eukaryotic-like serine/threonine-protein kinase